MRKQLIKNQKGFTLLELLIVIVIIGILAVLIIPNLVSGPQRARDSQRKSDLRNIKTALETYYNDNNQYPNTSWKTDLSSGTAPYMKTIPQDPKTQADYSYTPTCTTTCTDYKLSTTFENKGDSQATDKTTGAYDVYSANH
jgi:type II secretion system protein G